MNNDAFYALVECAREDYGPEEVAEAAQELLESLPMDAYSRRFVRIGVNDLRDLVQHILTQATE